MATQLPDAFQLATGMHGVAPVAAARQLMQALLVDTKGTLDNVPYGGYAL